MINKDAIKILKGIQDNLEETRFFERYAIDMAIEALKKEDRWLSVDEVKPEPHEDVIVRGVEMFSGKEVFAVKQFDVDTFRPASAPSVVWKEWHKIPK